MKRTRTLSSELLRRRRIIIIAILIIIMASMAPKLFVIAFTINMKSSRIGLLYAKFRRMGVNLT